MKSRKLKLVCIREEDDTLEAVAMPNGDIIIECRELGRPEAKVWLNLSGAKALYEFIGDVLNAKEES